MYQFNCVGVNAGVPGGLPLRSRGQDVHVDEGIMLNKLVLLKF